MKFESLIAYQIERIFMRYEDFVEKFKPKKTTDDCYTPSAVYDAVRQWVIDKYNLQSREIVRPFYPGGDYENYQYSPDCVVIDNPPFSIFSKICKFYLDRDIKFFLFAPHLTICNEFRRFRGNYPNRTGIN